MAAKTKKASLPEGMDELLDRIGRDTRTSTLCVAGDWLVAKEWVENVLGIVPVLKKVTSDDGDESWEPTGGMKPGAFAFLEQKDGAPRPTSQNQTNRSRSDAYTALSSMLAELA